MNPYHDKLGRFTIRAAAAAGGDIPGMTSTTQAVYRQELAKRRRAREQKP